MMKTNVTVLRVIACLVLMGTVAGAQGLVENFNYSAGQLTNLNSGANVSGGNWVNFSGTGNPIQVSSGNLTYTGYSQSGIGNKIDIISVATSAEDAYRQFVAQGSGTTNYASFLVNVANTTSLAANSSTTGDYFAGFLPSNSTTALVSRVSIRLGVGASTFQLGLRATSSNTAATFSNTDLSPGTTYLVVIAYQLVSGNANDTTRMWINPPVDGSQPAADLSQATATTTDNVDVARFFVRQGTTTTPNASIDGIRVAASWAGLHSTLVDEVTFRVNMSVKWQEGKFLPGSGDTVRVVGSFNNWSATDTTVRMTRNSTGDSIWVLTRFVDSTAVQDDTVYYKFFKTSRGGDWESVNNRVYALVNGSHQTPVWFFDNDSTVNALVNVTFRVNMAIKMRELTFQPSSGDTVRVVGSFQGWNTADTTVRMAKGTSDSVFSATIIANESDKLFYKFYKKPNRGGLDWEGDQPTGSKNREYTVPVGGGSTAVSWFDNDSVFNQTVITSITWQTDVAPYMTLGWFDATKDTMEVRGGFTGWSGQKMQPLVLTPSIWQYQSTGLLLPVGDEMQYKFYLRLDSAGAVTRFPGLVWGGSSDNRDGFLYEHPAQRGDGNNQYTVQNQTSQAPQRHWFSGINPQGLLGANDSVTVTLKVNMGPATRYSNAFNYTSDTLFVVWQDALWRSAQEKNQGVAFPQVVKMTRQSGTDSVYSLSFKVKGKTHYNMQYTYRFKKADGTTVDQGGGLGGQNPFITRFIQKLSGAWPATHTAPTDAWQKDAPLPGETAQFTTDVPEAPNQPLTYELYQNYPNPFNPVTMISYTLPQQATVKLRVYNILGQQVAELVNTLQPAGAHTVGFDAHRLSTGVYFYRIEAGSFVDVKKMILLK